MSNNVTDPRTVWIVDDSPADAERVRRALEAEHDLRVFTDGSDALERLSHGDVPDVMILDWVMPGVSGIDVCQFVRAGGPRLRELGLLLLTARAETQQVVEGLAAGANDFVAKPFHGDELRARVGALLRSKALRERAEAAEALAATLVHRAPDPILAVDAAGVVTFQNDEARAALGEVVGRPIAEVLPDLPRDNINVGPGESLFPLPDVRLGDRLFAPALRSAPVADAVSTTVILRDVTETRRAHARRLDFYSIMAHDLRTPLTSTLLRTDMILRGKYGVLAPRLVEQVRKVDVSLRSLVAIINDFLDLARLQGVPYLLEREDLDLAAVVDEVMDGFTPLLDLHRLTWTPVRAGGPALVRGDRRRLAQAVTNLVANAIKFTPATGTVTTRVTAGADGVEVAVEDTGRGIAPEALATVFDRFVREVDPAHPVAGSGLGLMIVREVVQAHGGVVGADSTPGAGSRFWFRLPGRRS
ncbi:MAG: response regulator [Planctomycetes bacterium]|nr:response regulator [Planctomycetota bacterium]